MNIFRAFRIGPQSYISMFVFHFAFVFLNEVALSTLDEGGRLDKMMSFHHYSAMFALEDVFFEVVEPAELRYTYLIQVTRDFGAPFNFTLAGVHLVPVDHPQACGDIENCDQLEGGVALIQRGDCPFVEKVIRVQRCGALAAVVFDDDPENVESYLEMTSDSKEIFPSIPAAFLLGKNGYMIWETLEQLRLSHAIINIPINASMYHIHQRQQPPWVLW